MPKFRFKAGTRDPNGRTSCPSWRDLKRLSMKPSQVVMVLWWFLCFTCLFMTVASFSDWQDSRAYYSLAAGVIHVCFTALYAGAALYVQCRSSRAGKPPIAVYESMCVLTLVLILFEDVNTLGQCEFWWLTLLVQSAMYLGTVRSAVRVLTCTTSIVYMLVTVLWLNSDGEQNAFGEVPTWRSSWASSNSTRHVAVALVRFIAFFASMMIVKGTFAEKESTLQIVREVSTRLSVFDLERAEQALHAQRGEEAHCLGVLTQNLRRYRPYLPPEIMVGREDQQHGVREYVLAVVKVRFTLPQGGADVKEEVLKAVFHHTKLRGGWVHTFDSTAALLVFGMGRADAAPLEGIWGHGSLSFEITKDGAAILDSPRPASLFSLDEPRDGEAGYRPLLDATEQRRAPPQYTLRVLGGRHGLRDSAPLVERPGPAGLAVGQYLAADLGGMTLWLRSDANPLARSTSYIPPLSDTLRDGAALLGSPAAAVAAAAHLEASPCLQVFVEPGNGDLEDGAGHLPPGVQSFSRLLGMTLAACEASLAIQEAARSKVSGELEAAVVLDDCEVGVFGNDERRVLSVQGDAVDRVEEVLALLPEITTEEHMPRVALLCNHRAARFLLDSHGVDEVHPGPPDDGPIYAFGDKSRAGRLEREEISLRSQLPVDRQLDLSEVTPKGTWGELGSGKTGVVYGARCTRMQKQVAVKELRQGASAHERVMFLKEIKALNELRWDTIVNFFGYTTDTCGTLYVVMEYCAKGPLKALVYDRALSDAQRAAIMREAGSSISQALTYMHSKKLVHMDVAARNVLVTAGDGYRLADLGFTTAVGRSSKAVCWPWAPPEAVQAFPQVTAAYTYDVWSFGMLAYEILSGGAPYGSGTAVAAVKTQLRQGKLPHPPVCAGRDVACEKLWREMVQPCLAVQPLARPGMSQLASLFDKHFNPTSQQTSMGSPFPRSATSKELPRRSEENGLTSSNHYASLDIYGTAGEVYGTVPSDAAVSE